MAAPPKWAQELVLSVWLREGRDDLPELVWHRSRFGLWSSGRAFSQGNRIVVTAGKSRMFQKLALLHELAHLLRPAREHHSPAFWDKAWELYRWAKLPLLRVRQHEGGYRKQALLAYSRNRSRKGA